MSQVTIKSLIDLKKWVEDFARKLKTKDIILLAGSMGSGKTQLTRYLVEVLGGDETASPSFSVINNYSIAHATLSHIDLYRLEDEEDLESTGFWDLFANDNQIVVIEWADRLNFDSLPLDWRKWSIKIDIKNDKARQLSCLKI